MDFHWNFMDQLDVTEITMTLGHAQRELPTSKKKNFAKLLNHDIRYEPGYSLIMRKGPKVDAKAQLPGMTKINDLTGLNQALLKAS